jgi:hypothetical protein
MGNFYSQQVFKTIAQAALHLLQLPFKKWRHSTRTRPPGGWSLDTIPLELLLDVTDLLAPEGRAALALTNRTMLFKLGKRSLSLEVEPRYRLLKLLSQDGMFLPEVLCPLCRIFHTPFVGVPWTLHSPFICMSCRSAEEAVRAEDWTAQNLFMLALPDAIPFNLVAAVLRCHRHKYPFLNMDLLLPSEILQDKRAMIQVHHNFRIVKAHLLLKTERLILLGQADTGTIAVQQARSMILEHRWVVNQICAHSSWTSMFPDMGGTPLPRHTCSKGPLKNSTPACHDYILCNSVVVRSCAYCYTDHTFSYVDLPGKRGRVCALTTWKDLGSGDDPEGPEWKSHNYIAMTFAEYVAARQNSEIGKVFKAIEGPGSGIRYKASISRRRMEAFGEQ